MDRASCGQGRLGREERGQKGKEERGEALPVEYTTTGKAP